MSAPLDNAVADIRYKIGDDVRIFPTKGGYQPELKGRVVGETRTEWRVVIAGTFNNRPTRFRKSNGSPVEKLDQRFPYYCMKV